MKLTIAQLKQMQAEAKNLEELLEILYRLSYARDAADYSEDELCLLAYEVKQQRERAALTATRVLRKATEVLERLDRPSIEYCGLSSSGELQSDGPAFDVEIARYADKFQALAHAIERRRRDERAAAFQAELDKLRGTITYAVLNEIKNNSGITFSRLKREFTYPADKLGDAIAQLTGLHLIRTYGTKNQPKFTANDADGWEGSIKDAAEQAERDRKNTPHAFEKSSREDECGLCCRHEGAYVHRSYSNGNRKPGSVCFDCGRTVTEAEYANGESTCCHRGVVPEEEYGKAV